MAKRSFQQDFEEIVNEDDCLTEEMASARSLADRQPGRWKVWSYRPSRDVPESLPDDEVQISNTTNEFPEEQQVSESDCIMMCRLAAPYLI